MSVGNLHSDQRCGGTEGATEGLRSGTSTCACGLEDLNMVLVQNGEQFFAKRLRTHLVENVQHHGLVEKCPLAQGGGRMQRDAVDNEGVDVSNRPGSYVRVGTSPVDAMGGKVASMRALMVRSFTGLISQRCMAGARVRSTNRWASSRL